MTASRSAPRVLVAGHLTHDRNQNGFLPGGCAYYASQVYRQLAARVHLAVTVGTDFVFDDVLHQVDCTLTRCGQTTVFANIYPGSEAPRIQLIESTAPNVVPLGIPDDMLNADIVHLAPVIGELDIDLWRRATHANILAISVQGWLRQRGVPVSHSRLAALAGDDVATWARGHYVVSAPWNISAESLAGIDIAFLSCEDLDGQTALLHRLCAAIPTVVLTDGAKGCDVIQRAPNGQQTRTHVGTYATDEVDATGAGDTLAAGCLYRLACGDDPVEAARFGAAAASILVEGTGVSTLDRLSEAASRVPAVPVTPSS